MVSCARKVKSAYLERVSMKNVPGGYDGAVCTMPDLSRLPRTVSLDIDSSGKVTFVYVNQRQLPQTLTYEKSQSWLEVIDAIKTLAVRGAPAIGVSGAAALALWATYEGCTTESSYESEFADAARKIIDARPTAVNLEWGVQRVLNVAQGLLAQGVGPQHVAQELCDEVKRMEAQDEATNRALGKYGAALMPRNARILTHCNAGSLATVFYGTALGVVYAAAERGGVARVFADETRPVGQGSRLTSWELAQVGIPVTLICDNMSASVMAKGNIDAVVVGADRIAANGDTANKIGTYGVAVLARAHNIPFYIAAPVSTIDFSITRGDDIPIEVRDSTEVLPLAIEGVDVWNPAFDVTPAEYIAGIITEEGVFKPEELKSILGNAMA